MAPLRAPSGEPAGQDSLGYKVLLIQEKTSHAEELSCLLQRAEEIDVVFRACVAPSDRPVSANTVCGPNP